MATETFTLHSPSSFGLDTVTSILASKADRRSAFHCYRELRGFTDMRRLWKRQGERRYPEILFGNRSNPRFARALLQYPAMSTID